MHSCQFCSKPIIKKKNSSIKKYCSNVCSAAGVKAKTYQRFLAGELSHPQTLRTILISILGQKCSSCGCDEWMGRPMPIEVEHIDGDSTNNKPENLTLICPNCHTLTPTYKSKNRGKGRHSRRRRYAEGKSY